MKPTQIDTERGHILYDADLLGQADDPFFDPAHWAACQQLLRSAPGRGTTVFVQHEERLFALRHYCRGGLPARISRDRYLWLGLERSRPWREWRLLLELRRRALPVPRPVAVRVVRHGLTYSADIVTEVIANARPLAEWLGERRLPAAQLEQVGVWLRRFHREGLDHADLNARNILLDGASKVYLIDFDRCKLRRGDGGWRRANLARLRRSLEKFRRNERDFHFGDEAWRSLLQGYEGG
ncbi:MAG: 3-deoxy-D-manno-octulosonic acid kinase [Gammaproteobacteria bacterium]|nr:3-deoxy-D-manno-octulosonic acid kinase [Gammaproteobacteria bacterium]